MQKYVKTCLCICIKFIFLIKECKGCFHAGCYEKTECRFDILWQGNLTYIKGRKYKVNIRSKIQVTVIIFKIFIKVLNHYWQMTQDFIHVFESNYLKKKLHKIPLKSIQMLTNGENTKCTKRCSFHFRFKNLEFHCGIDSKSCMPAKNFYEILEFVCLARNSQNEDTEIKAPIQHKTVRL